MKPFQNVSVAFSESEVVLRKFTFCTLATLLGLVLLSAVSMASPPSLIIVNADFSAIPVVCAGGFAYQSFGGDCNSPNPQQDFNATPGFGWTYLLFSGNGVTEPNTAFNPPSFTGMPFTEAAFLQDGASFVLQAIDGFSASQTYALSFYLGSRFESDPADGDQTVQASIDSQVVGTWALTSFTPFTRETATFTVPTDGVHTLQFEGLHFGDHTAFLSGVAISTVPEPSSLALMLAGVLGAGAIRGRSFWRF
jgi:hypothetical protein